MYFNVYSDTGETIEGYLIPDGFSTKPMITVTCNSETYGPFNCDVFLEGPLKHGHHDTGVVGFRLDNKNVPALSTSLDLEIVDDDTGFVIYRRYNPGKHVAKKLFRLETQFAPHRELDNSLKGYFQFHAGSAELYGGETVRQMLEIVNQPSAYVSGRVLLRTVHRYFTDDTIRIASLRDPFYELAIRLLTVASHKKRPLNFMSERDVILFEPAMQHFVDTNFSDPQNIKAKILSAHKDILGLFESPFTHQLVATNPTEKVSRDGVSSALDALSQFAVFDPHETGSDIADAISESTGIARDEIAFSPVRSPFLELADVLREIKIIERVLENDLILLHFIRKAEQRASS
ncbi:MULTISPECIES: hypothetical protein [Agrobacterium]|uniref:Uncharacterized protein n=1 Tax=Agrobacterium tumefaciens TaxID=358 RepID=A0AAJ4N3N0_AGRTU|nr:MULTISPECIES: hypothetical protein [Agrobacterium]KAA3520919.1 hypothetical protein DXM29_24640 [Agrobacterium tumefaciens]MBO9111642.1 hypothetical protein [Agrobacterium sp. S2/73]NTA18768.1 hypothetical protein [Agrobacterium tumefaciens]NTA83581.1 hypothetical protein [Agrobacterium tumefaciens]OCJ66152.1 hypothetical protein A6U97_27205 [Agrobacterium tumefaciens]